MESVNLKELISTIVSSLLEKAVEQGDNLFHTGTDKLPPLKLDQTKISEVITNLLNNGIKFTKNGTVTIKTELKNDEVVVSIADSGIGIDEEDQKHLFQKFHQVDRFNPDQPREQQGTGLGLFISKNIVELHGGRMWLESAKNKGSTFFFALPINPRLAKLPADKPVVPALTVNQSPRGQAIGVWSNVARKLARLIHRSSWDEGLFDFMLSLFYQKRAVQLRHPRGKPTGYSQTIK